MRVRKKAVGALPRLLVASVLLVVLAAGCGGEDQSGNQQGGQQGDAEPANSKIALGTIQGVDQEKKKVSLKPTTQDQGAKPLNFRVNARAKISLGGQEREMGDIQDGQQAQIEYVEKDKGPDRAVSVELFATGQDQQQPQEGEQTN